ncbi:13383_t:CDS:2, partial [Gigaspora margarita]
LWEGKLWVESPLFGQSDITISQGGLGVFIADLPQENDIAGVLYHNAYRDKEFQLINEQISSNAKSRFCSQYGLCS